MRTLSIRSLRRLTERKRVDLPQPDGPMRAVILPRGIFIEMSKSACLGPYQRLKPSICRTISSRLSSGLTVVSIFSLRVMAWMRPSIILVAEEGAVCDWAPGSACGGTLTGLSGTVTAIIGSLEMAHFVFLAQTVAQPHRR